MPAIFVFLVLIVSVLLWFCLSKVYKVFGNKMIDAFERFDDNVNDDKKEFDDTINDKKGENEDGK